MTIRSSFPAFRCSPSLRQRCSAPRRPVLLRDTERNYELKVHGARHSKYSGLALTIYPDVQDRVSRGRPRQRLSAIFRRRFHRFATRFSVSVSLLWRLQPLPAAAAVGGAS